MSLWLDSSSVKNIGCFDCFKITGKVLTDAVLEVSALD